MPGLQCKVEDPDEYKCQAEAEGGCKDGHGGGFSRRAGVKCSKLGRREQKMEEQIRKNVAMEHQAQYSLRMMTCAVNEKSEQAEQIKTLRMELLQTQQNMKVTALMADSYEAMAIGKDYQGYTVAITTPRCGSTPSGGYDNLEEIQRREEIQGSMQNEEAATASQGSVPKGVRKDASPLKTRSSSRTRIGRHGYD